MNSYNVNRDLADFTDFEKGFHHSAFEIPASALGVV